MDASDGAASTVKINEKTGEPYITWASEEDGKAKVRAWMDGNIQRMRPAVERLAEAARSESKQIAADLGEPYDSRNEMFWATLYNVVVTSGHSLNSGSPELRAVLEVARAAAADHRQREQWREAKRVTEAMFDEGDAGEAVGLGDVCLNLLPDDDANDRATVLAECAAFYKVPAAYVPAIGQIVTDMMVHVAMRNDGSRWNLPQHWANVYSYVCGAIAARCLPDGA